MSDALRTLGSGDETVGLIESTCNSANPIWRGFPGDGRMLMYLYFIHGSECSLVTMSNCPINQFRILCALRLGRCISALG